MSKGLVYLYGLFFPALCSLPSMAPGGGNMIILSKLIK